MLGLQRLKVLVAKPVPVCRNWLWFLVYTTKKSWWQNQFLAGGNWFWFLVCTTKKSWWQNQFPCVGIGFVFWCAAPASLGGKTSCHAQELSLALYRGATRAAPPNQLSAPGTGFVAQTYGRCNPENQNQTPRARTGFVTKTF